MVKKIFGLGLHINCQKMREGSRRSTGLLSVYYYLLSTPKRAFCFDGLARGPLRVPRTPDAIPFSLQQPIPLYPLFPSPLPLRPTASSYSPSPPTFLLLHPPFFSFPLSYYTITIFLPHLNLLSTTPLSIEATALCTRALRARCN